MFGWAASWAGTSETTKPGLRFGELGLDLVDNRGLGRLRARVYLAFAVHVAHWSQPLAACRVFLRRAFEAAREAGDLTYAAYSCSDLTSNLLAAGAPLGDIEREARNALEFVGNVRFGRHRRHHYRAVQAYPNASWADAGLRLLR